MLCSFTTGGGALSLKTVARLHYMLRAINKCVENKLYINFGDGAFTRAKVNPSMSKFHECSAEKPKKPHFIGYVNCQVEAVMAWKLKLMIWLLVMLCNEIMRWKWSWVDGWASECSRFYLLCILTFHRAYQHYRTNFSLLVVRFDRGSSRFSLLYHREWCEKRRISEIEDENRQTSKGGVKMVDK